MTKTELQDYELMEAGTVDPHLVMTTGNNRSNYNNDSINELADNMKLVGVLEPIICRPLEADEKGSGPTMCLVSGHRRLFAARIAKIPLIPFRLLNLNKETAVGVQLFENLHRENLSTIDEARAFSNLLDLGKYTKEDLAERANKSVSYVTKALALLDLPKEAIEAIEAGKLTPSHGHQIMRVPEEKRAEVVEWATREQFFESGLPTLKELTRYIEGQFGRTLDNAVFPQACEYAGRQACAICPSNSANQTMLFAGAEDGNCMNPECFAAKVAAFDAQVAEEAATKYKGMKCLGSKDPKYNCHGHMRAVGKGLVVEGDLAKNPDIKKAIKNNPGAFAYAVDANTHKTIMVLQDADMVAEIKRAQEKHGSNTGAAGNSREELIERRRQEYIKEAVNRELLKAAAAAKITIGVPEAVKILGNLNYKPQWVCDAMGVLSCDTDQQYAKLPFQKLMKLIYLCSITDYDGEVEEKELARHGVNVKAIKKAAAKDAAAQWAVELAEAAQGKKKAKGAEGDED